MDTKLPHNRVVIAGLQIDALDERSCVESVMNALECRTGGWIITANLDHVRRYVHDPLYRSLCDEATVVVPDGRPLLWAAALQRTPLPGLVAGSNLIWKLSQAAALHGRTVYLLGGEAGTAEEAAHVLKSRFSSLNVAGTFYPEFGFERNPDQMDEMIRDLLKHRPDIVYVGLGSPKQELLIRSLREYLPDTWWIGVGISFSFVSGRVKRAPRWMQAVGLEWAHRLLQEPRRLFKRYIVHGVPFSLFLMSHSFRRRFDSLPPTVPSHAVEERRRTAA